MRGTMWVMSSRTAVTVISSVRRAEAERAKWVARILIPIGVLVGAWFAFQGALF